MEIGERIKLIRELKGLTQEEVCDQLGWNRTALSRIESGKIVIREKTIEAIAKVLNISVYRIKNDRAGFEPDEVIDPRKIADELNVEELINIVDSLELYFPGIKWDRKKVVRICKEINNKELIRDELTIKERAKKIGIREDILRKVWSYPAHTGLGGLIGRLNQAQVSIFDFFESAIIESKNEKTNHALKIISESEKKRVEVINIIDNLNIEPQSEIKFFDINEDLDLILFYLPLPSTLEEFIKDKNNIELYKLTGSEIFWLIHIPNVMEGEFRKQDYIDMLLINRRAQKQKKGGELAQGN